MPPAATLTEAQAPAFFALPRWHRVRKHPTLIIGALLLIAVAIIAAAAPWIATHDPQDIGPLARMLPPSAGHWFGTDALGRDVFSRAVWGARVSLIVGVSVALLAPGLGVVIGLASGLVRWADGFIMRVMDGLMAIPRILLDIPLVSVTQASLATVIVAITVPEIPRVVRLGRSLALTLREQPFVEGAHAGGTRLPVGGWVGLRLGEQPFVEAAHAVGTRLPMILARHIVPGIVAPLMVLATFVAAAA